MRVELFGATSSEIGGSPATTTAAPQETGAQTSTVASPQDTATISSGGYSISSLTAQALGMASTMEARVEALREAVNSGQYGLEPNQIANAMLSDGL